MLRQRSEQNTRLCHLPTSSNLWLWRLGPTDTTGIKLTFLSELGHRLASVTGDPRETTYLFQRVSLAVQRYNSVAFKGNFLVPTDMD